MKREAIIDKTKKYRYMLKRQWGKGERFVNFIMLNPSTADDKVDDPTIRRCISFAKRWEFEGIYVTNLFALRATDPEELKSAENPVGKENNLHLADIANKSDKIILSWGNKGLFMGRDKEVLEILKDKEKYCLEISRTGQPKHPLYVHSNVKPIIFK